MRFAGILQASRSHYCIHKGVQKKPNLDEECEALLEDKRCKFYNNAQKLYGMQTSSSLQARLHRISADLSASSLKEYRSEARFNWVGVMNICPG